MINYNNETGSIGAKALSLNASFILRLCFITEAVLDANTGQARMIS